MQSKKHLVFALSICALLLGACSLPASASPTPDPLYIESIVQTRIAAIPTNTQPPTVTPTLIAATPTVTPLTFLATPTLTLFYQPTVTSTPSLTECPLIITVKDTKAGDMLHILRCEDKLEYDLPPLAKGIYAVGPNLKFIVYVTNNGFVYASKIGNPYIALVANLVRERSFTAINKRVPPKFAISFFGEEPHYKLVLSEKKYGQKFTYFLPINITE